MPVTRQDSKSRIEIWATGVALETPSTFPNHILSPTSGNLGSHKRKRNATPLRASLQRVCKSVKTMATQDEHIHTTDPIGRPRRGCPPGTTQGVGKVHDRTPAADAAVIAEQLFSKPPSLASSTVADSKMPTRPGSPRKRGRDINQARSDAGIDMKFLESCRPSVKLRSYQEARQHGVLPQMVSGLYNRLHDTPAGFIPSRLKPIYDKEADTPRKTRDPPLQKNFSAQESWIPEGHLQRLKSTVDRVVKMAARNYRTGAHERQWSGTVVLPLIEEVLKSAPNPIAVCLNIETCSIEPLQLRMVRPNGTSLDDESRTAISKSSISAADEGDATTSRMVDLSLGLDLDETEADTVINAFKRMKDNEHSLNQTMAYIRDTPLFLDIELKKAVSNRDPDVQLAIWQAALHSKRIYHGWDTSMPMPGIVVNGHEWQYYLSFERNGGMVMMGPQAFGSTKDINGTYEIAYKLNVLVQWGTTEYRAWFKEHILGWCLARS